MIFLTHLTFINYCGQRFQLINNISEEPSLVWKHFPSYGTFP